MTRESRLPVDLLRDGRGVYGIGIIEDYQHEPDKVLTPPTRLILRPDCMAAHDDGLPCPRAVLQKIAGGFRRGPFCRSVEEGLRQLIHHAALRRSGLSWPPTSPQAWWSDDPIQQAKNRATYHGLRLSSLSAINKLMGPPLRRLQITMPSGWRDGSLLTSDTRSIGPVCRVCGLDNWPKHSRRWRSTCTHVRLTNGRAKPSGWLRAERACAMLRLLSTFP